MRITKIRVASILKDNDIYREHRGNADLEDEGFEGPYIDIGSEDLNEELRYKYEQL